MENDIDSKHGELKKQVRVLLADDHALIVGLLAESLRQSTNGRYSVLVALSGEEAVEVALLFRPDIVLMDIGFVVPNKKNPMDGFEAARRIIDELSDCRILMLTERLDERAIRKAELLRGFSGYLHKSITPEELASAIDLCLLSNAPVNRHVLRPSTEVVPQPKLTNTELEVLELMAEGQRNRDISEELGIGTGTVKGHVHNILSELGAKSRTEAVHKAQELGLLPGSRK